MRVSTFRKFAIRASLTSGAVIISLLVSGCGGGDGGERAEAISAPPPPPPPPPVARSYVHSPGGVSLQVNFGSDGLMIGTLPGLRFYGYATFGADGGWVISDAVMRIRETGTEPRTIRGTVSGTFGPDSIQVKLPESRPAPLPATSSIPAFNSQPAPSLATIAAQYTARVSLGRGSVEVSSFAVQANGRIHGVSDLQRGCSFDGTIAPPAAGDTLYSAVATFTGDCDWPIQVPIPMLVSISSLTSTSFALLFNVAAPIDYVGFEGIGVP